MLDHLDLLAGAIVSLGVIGGLLAGLYKIVARITRVHDVILGNEHTPGVAARLDVLETRTLQLVPNGGGSLKDDMQVLRGQVTDLGRKQQEDRLTNAELRGAQSEQMRLVRHDINNVRATSSLLTDLLRQTIQNGAPVEVRQPQGLEGQTQ